LESINFAAGFHFIIMQGISMAFENIMPSFHPIDLLVGIAVMFIFTNH